MRSPRPARAVAPATLRAAVRAAVTGAVLLVALPALAGGPPPAEAAGDAGAASLKSPAPARAPAHGAATRRGVTPAQHARIRAVLHLEAAWLRATTVKQLAPILAPDFVHPVAAGVLLDRAGQLAWFARHPPDPKLRRGFSALKIRLLGDAVAVVNGRVDARDAHGRLVHRTVFTDVFQYRHGAWKAVSAQETPVRRPARRTKGPERAPKPAAKPGR